MIKKTLTKLQHKKKQPIVKKRITKDTIAEHRQRVLSGGRRYKYPVQYAKHKLVFNTLIITIASLLLFAGIGWWLLYPMQNSSQFAYRVTQFLPLPVASVDGESARYSDYLTYLRPSEYYLDKYGEVSLDTKGGQKQLTFIKRQALDQAEMVALARKYSKQLDISVTSDDVNRFIERERASVQGGVSQETYDSAIQMMYGESISDYRLRVHNGILRDKVSFAIDDDATAQMTKVNDLLALGKADMASVVESVGGMAGAKVTHDTLDVDRKASTKFGVPVQEIFEMNVGDTSSALKSTANYGYYFVRVLEKSQNTAKIEYINIPLAKFQAEFKALQKADKIHEFITVRATE